MIKKTYISKEVKNYMHAVNSVAQYNINKYKLCYNCYKPNTIPTTVSNTGISAVPSVKGSIFNASYFGTPNDIQAVIRRYTSKHLSRAGTKS